MHPLRRLQHLLAPPVSPNHGTILAIGTDLRIATSSGLLSVPRAVTDATVYRVGDSVVLANGVVVGRRNGTPTVYVV